MNNHQDIFYCFWTDSHQSQPGQLSWFSFKNKRAVLTGNASYLSRDELFQWLETLQIINQQDEILCSYQREYNEDLQRKRA